MNKTVEQVRLHEILNSSQRRKLRELLFKERKKETEPVNLSAPLKKLFAEWQQELLGRGILSDYLAYAVSFLVMRFGYDAMIEETKQDGAMRR